MSLSNFEKSDLMTLLMTLMMTLLMTLLILNLLMVIADISTAEEIAKEDETGHNRIDLE